MLLQTEKKCIFDENRSYGLVSFVLPNLSQTDNTQLVFNVNELPQYVMTEVIVKEKRMDAVSKDKEFSDEKSIPHLGFALTEENQGNMNFIR